MSKENGGHIPEELSYLYVNQQLLAPLRDARKVRHKFIKSTSTRIQLPPPRRCCLAKEDRLGSSL